MSVLFKAMNIFHSMTEATMFVIIIVATAICMKEMKNVGQEE